MDPNAPQTQQPVTQQTGQSQFPQTAPTSSRTPLPKMLLIVFGIVAVLGLIVGAYYLGTQKHVTVISSVKRTAVVSPSSVTTSPSNTPTPIPDVTINWKSYTSSDNSFSFKYPNDNNWKLTELSGAGYADVDVQCPHISCPQPYNIYDFAGGTASTLPISIDSYINSLNTTNPSVNSHASPYIFDYQKIKINGLDAVETLAQTGKLAGSEPIVTVFLVSNGKGYSFGYTYTDVSLNTVTKLSQLPKPNPDFVSTFQVTK